MKILEEDGFFINQPINQNFAIPHSKLSLLNSLSFSINLKYLRINLLNENCGFNLNDLNRFKQIEQLEIKFKYWKKEKISNYH